GLRLQAHRACASLSPSTDPAPAAGSPLSLHDALPIYLAFRVYQPDRLVLGKRMEDHLRFAVCYWHSFSWAGNDIFGFGTFDRPWISDASDPLRAAEQKMDAAFEFFAKLGVPFFCFHDVDIAPYTDSLVESVRNLEHMVDRAEKKMAETGVKLLWGTANLFSHPRYAAGAATNPDPD